MDRKNYLWYLGYFLGGLTLVFGGYFGKRGKQNIVSAGDWLYLKMFECFKILVVSR